MQENETSLYAATRDDFYPHHILSDKLNHEKHVMRGV